MKQRKKKPARKAAPAKSSNRRNRSSKQQRQPGLLRRVIWNPLSKNRWLQLLIISPVLLVTLLILIFSALPVPTSSFMLQSEVKPVAHQWVPMEQIDPWAALAVIAAEDQRFPQHWGLDTQAMWRAAKKNWRNRHSGRRVGGSTITQQLAKNLFLWPGGYFRKIIEAPIALLLELAWSKERILEVYLNVAEFGPGIYGIEAAAQRYFWIPASELSRWQAAQLAALLPNPSMRHVWRATANQQQRARWIEQQMQQLSLAYLERL
ncbi:MAG: monofunctional biosynthetic peptidoglycan transglycosylase [Nevskiales bacterium]